MREASSLGNSKTKLEKLCVGGKLREGWEDQPSRVVIVGNDLLQLEVNEVLGVKRTLFLLGFNWRWCSAVEVNVTGSRRDADAKENVWELRLRRGGGGRVGPDRCDSLNFDNQQVEAKRWNG